MKAMIGLVAVMFLFVGGLSAEPYAPLLPLNEQAKQVMKASGKTDAQRNKEAPSKDEIDIPAYPDAYLSTGGESNGVLSNVELVSSDSPKKVIAWYKNKLVGKGWQFIPELATKQLNEVGVFVESSNPKLDAFDALKFRQIRIRKVEKPEDVGLASMFGDVSGVKSVISIQVKPVM